MLDRQGGVILFECDGCAAVLDTREGDFDAAHDRFKTEGWRAGSRKRLGKWEWTHRCPDCSAKRG